MMMIIMMMMITWLCVIGTLSNRFPTLLFLHFSHILLIETSSHKFHLLSRFIYTLATQSYFYVLVYKAQSINILKVYQHCNSQLTLLLIPFLSVVSSWKNSRANPTLKWVLIKSAASGDNLFLPKIGLQNPTPKCGFQIRLKNLYPKRVLIKSAASSDSLFLPKPTGLEYLKWVPRNVCSV